MCLCFVVNLFFLIYFIKNKFWGYRKKEKYFLILYLEFYLNYKL